MYAIKRPLDQLVERRLGFGGHADSCVAQAVLASHEADVAVSDEIHGRQAVRETRQPGEPAQKPDDPEGCKQWDERQGDQGNKFCSPPHSEIVDSVLGIC